MKKMLCFLLVLLFTTMLSSCDYAAQKELDNITYEETKIENFIKSYSNDDITIYIIDNCQIGEDLSLKRYSNTIDKNKETLSVLKTSKYDEYPYSSSKNALTYDYELASGINSSSLFLRVYCQMQIISICSHAGSHFVSSSYTRYYILDDESFAKLVNKIESILKKSDESEN